MMISTLELPEELEARLDGLARKKGESRNALILAAIEEWLCEREIKLPARGSAFARKGARKIAARRTCFAVKRQFYARMRSDDQEDIARADEVMTGIRAGAIKVYPAEEVWKRLGLED